MNKNELLARLRERLNRPARADEIVRVLRIPRLERAGVKRALRQLVEDGSLVLTRGHLYALPRKPATRASQPAAPPPRHLVGRFERDALGQAYVIPFDRRASDDVLVPRSGVGDAEPGLMVLVEITRHAAAGQPPSGVVTEVLGSIDEPGVDTAIILRKHGIPEEHGAEALAEASRVAAAVGAADLDGRTDFRDRVIVTIDGEHARDFDDAISIERLANGHYRLGVHIADVAHYVKEGSALDREAYERGTSVYFPERAVHMFPEKLATGVCSLNPHVDRLVQTCVMDVTPGGDVARHEFHDGVIRSAERMTYTDVNAILTDQDSEARARYASLVPSFELMGELFRILNRRRRERGSVDFDLPKPEVLLDSEGLVSGIVPSERNLAHRLIEEFMLLANETVASHLEDAGMPTLYRIHEVPDALKVEQFDEFVRALGFALDAPPDRVQPKHFQALVEKIKGSPVERPIAFLMLRTMQKARYDSVNMGHFGLAAPSYTHFTSPIRRYPDLVVHRLLRELRHTRVTAERREALEVALPEVGRHTSERERRADEAERELIQWKKVRFMADKVGDVFDGCITGVTHFGLFVELVDHYVEGLAHISTLGDDYYQFTEGSHALVGERTQRRFRLGDRLRVRIVRVDLERRMIDLAVEEVLAAIGEQGAGVRDRRPGVRDPRPGSRGQRSGVRSQGAAAKRKESGTRGRGRATKSTGRASRSAEEGRESRKRGQPPRKQRPGRKERTQRKKR